jgi:lipoprotein-anchoring transpeptidase ErfK/SrfK
MARWFRMRPRLLIIGSVTFLVVLLAGSVAGAFAYDQANQDRILPGVRIDGTDVGGMTRDQATAAMEARAAQLLARPIAIRAGVAGWDLTLADLGVRVQVSKAVGAALSVSGSMSLMSRVYHRLIDRPVDQPIALRYRVAVPELRTFLQQASAVVDTKPRDASLAMSADGMGIVARRSEPGRAIDVAGSVRALMAAVRTGATQVNLPFHSVQPQVTSDTLGKTITIDLSTNTLRLYDGFNVERTYPVATAREGFTTPPGLWEVVAKEENPAWYNPDPTGWAASMPAYIPPGPDNPLGLRALALDASGILIHGTPESYSIGTYASHGCIRMYESDAIALFPLVPQGTPVIIYGAPPWGNSVSANPAGF